MLSWLKRLRHSKQGWRLAQAVEMEQHVVERLENAKSARVAAQWMVSSSFDDLYMMRAALSAEVSLMHELLGATSAPSQRSMMQCMGGLQAHA